MNKSIELLARLFLGHIFLLAGINKISGYEGTAAYMDAMGVPGMLLPAVILLEIVGGLMIIAGFKTRWAAAALAGFTAVAAIIFHADFADQMQSIMFMKNITIVGGLMLLVVHGAGAFSLDSKLGNTADSWNDNRQHA